MIYRVYSRRTGQTIKQFDQESQAQHCKSRLNLTARSNEYEYTGIEDQSTELTEKYTGDDSPDNC